MLTGAWNVLALLVFAGLLYAASRTVPPRWIGLVSAALFTGYWLISGGPQARWLTVVAVFVVLALVAQSARALYLGRRDRSAARTPSGGADSV